MSHVYWKGTAIQNSKIKSLRKYLQYNPLYWEPQSWVKLCANVP